MTHALKRHWPEYLMEAAGLALFMVGATVFSTILEHPASPVRSVIPDAFLRRVLMGVLMGSIAVGIIYSPWGSRSGAHLNPSVTLTFLRLGKVEPWDALFYAASQFAGGLAGVLLAAAAIGMAIRNPAVNYAATRPGAGGAFVAFLGESIISFILMLVILTFSNSRRQARFTGLAAGTLVATFISFESPFSGMSMNPARTLASALPAGSFPALWVYFTAPVLGMLLAAHLHTGLRGAKAVVCAKLNHGRAVRCIFRCGY